MALNIKNAEVERLADEVAHLAGSSKTEAIRQALLEKKERLAASAAGNRAARLRQFLEVRIWPTIPASARHAWTREEEDAALGYGEHGQPV